MNVGHSRLDVSPELKLIAALRYLDSADLACPLVDILKQMAVDGFQVVEIKVTVRNAFSGPLCHLPPLKSIECSSIFDITQISENVGAGIDVRISHSAASGAARPLALTRM